MHVFVIKVGMLVNEVGLNHRCEYCFSVGLGMWLIFAFFNISLLFRGVTVGPPRVHLGEVRGLLESCYIDFIFLISD